MALRSAVRKMPALGFRPLPIGSRMPAAAPSRHLSRVNFPSATGGKKLKSYGQGEIDYTPEVMDRMNEEYNKNRVELQNNLAEFDKIMETIAQQTIAQLTAQQTADLPEIVRSHSENLPILMNKRLNRLVGAHFGVSAFLVIGTMYKHS